MVTCKDLKPNETCGVVCVPLVSRFYESVSQHLYAKGSGKLEMQVVGDIEESTLSGAFSDFREVELTALI